MSCYSCDAQHFTFPFTLDPKRLSQQDERNTSFFPSSQILSLVWTGRFEGLRFGQPWVKVKKILNTLWPLGREKWRDLSFGKMTRHQSQETSWKMLKYKSAFYFTLIIRQISIELENQGGLLLRIMESESNKNLYKK